MEGNFSSVRYDLLRFEEAQNREYQNGISVYESALSEIRAGRKESHWMWFIFPQLAGLGRSDASRYYGIRSLDEAAAYWQHPVLGPRLQDCCHVLLQHGQLSAYEILGSPDDLKLHSCATLFLIVDGTSTVLKEILARFCGGIPDPETLRLLGQMPEKK